MKYNTLTLPSGLRIIQQPSNSDVVHCGYVINVGTRDELPHESGMAHLIEHLLFKGTACRRAWHILNRMESVGGELNAFTNKEDTTVYCTCLAKDFARAADLLTDIVFRSTFPSNELAREISVIIDEIQSYQDSPSEQIFDDFEAMLFADHSLGRNILGEADALQKHTSEDCITFHSRHYTPANAVFFVLGNIGIQRIAKLLSAVNSSQAQPPNRALTPPANAIAPQHRTVKKDTVQSHVLMGATSYAASDPRRTVLYLLNNFLGGPGMNSRLNVELRERRGLVYNVEANLASYMDTGYWSIYFGTDANNADRCCKIIERELTNLCERGLSPTQLQRLKKQSIGQISIAAENNESMALGMGRTFLHFNKYETTRDFFERINAITPEQLRDVANDIYAPARISSLRYE